MNFDFFANLSQDDALKFLDWFLGYGSNNLPKGRSRDQRDLPSFSHALSERCLRIPLEDSGTNVPDWIRNTPAHKSMGKKITDRGSHEVFVAAYDFGQWFIDNHSRLSWAVGDSESAVQNMPVVTGFDKGLELSPLLVVENLTVRSQSSKNPSEIFRKALKKWESFLSLK